MSAQNKSGPSAFFEGMWICIGMWISKWSPQELSGGEPVPRSSPWDTSDLIGRGWQRHQANGWARVGRRGGDIDSLDRTSKETQRAFVGLQGV